MKTGLVWDERFVRHDTGMQGVLEQPHPYFEPLPTIDNPLSKVRLKNLLDRTGLTERLVAIGARHASRAELLFCHDEAYVDRIAAQSLQDGGEGGEATPFGHGSFEIAALAAGAVFAAVDAVMRGEVDNAYALVHPPGHHARRGMGVGFCLFANGPLAAHYLRAVHGAKRVAIVDWDVHHGNAAQEMFWLDPGVLAISLHQAMCYPRESGDVDEIGEGPGEGFNINIPLPPGSGEKAYMQAIDRIVVPALRRYRPDFILLAAGYDAGLLDPLGRMLLNAGSFGRMTERIRDTAASVCRGRIVATQEGGYDPSSVPFHGLATIEALSGICAGIDNPFAYPAPSALVPLRPDERSALASAEAMFLRSSESWA